MNDGSKKQESLTSGVGQPCGENPTSKPSLSPIKSTSATLKPLYEIYDELKEDIFSREKEVRFPIGLKAIDDLLWGLHKKHLVTIGARTSQGKSAFAINMMKNLADTKKKIIFFSLEMSRTQILERLLCSLCNINNIALQRGECHEDVRQASNVFEEWVNSADVLIDDQYGYHFDKVAEICKIIRPDFVFIDYIQMISVDKRKTKLDAIEDYVRRLKQLSMSLNFGSILLSQINRGGAENPSMSAYKGAGVLEEHSDVCIVLNWEWVKGEFNVTVEKNRHGRTGKFRVDFEPQYSRFSNYTPEPDMGVHTD